MGFRAPGAGRGDGPPSSKSEYVLQRLRAEITEGVLHPGAPLRQGEIAERYGVSATPVREALRLLEAEGLILYASHRGATVADFDGQRIDDLYRIRAELEGLGAAMAAERIEPDALERIIEIHETMVRHHEAEEVRELPRLNREFHFEIYEAASPVLASFVTNVWSSLPVTVTLWLNDKAFRQRLVDEHEDIVRSLRAGDVDAARSTMALHMKHAVEYRARRRAEEEARQADA